MPPKRKAAQDAEERAAASKPAERPKKAKHERLPKFEVFEKATVPLKVTITTADGKQLASFDAKPRTFSTKSYGLGGNAHVKLTVEIEGESRELDATVTLNIPVTGSKLAEEANGDDEA